MSTNLKGMLGAALLFLTSAGAMADEQAWLTDFEEARKVAREKKMPILAYFGGSDWCGWCIKLDREVWSQPEFKAYANGRLVLFLADFPARKPQADEVAAQNEKLAKAHQVRGFPTVLLLDAEGRELARTGYRPGGAQAYVDHIEGLVPKRHRPSAGPAASL